MSFDRLRTQVLCETLVGCTDLGQWNTYRAVFESLNLTSEQVHVLKSTLLEDAKDLYFKGLLSLSEAIYSMSRRLYSWATIKAYYSVFYLLRGSLALRDYAIVRNRSLYLLPLKVGESPKKKSSDRYRNDHVCVINVYRDLYANSDMLQSNTVDELNPYEWLMERRNQINYRQREFLDPNPPNFLQLISGLIQSHKLDELITAYVGDTRYLYCFQSNHACLALPIRRLFLTKEEFVKANNSLIFPQEKIDLVRKLLVINSEPLKSVDEFIV